jgi:hypothetical protein
VTRPDWHIAEDDLRAYVDGSARPPWLWSTEAHLVACPHCRHRLAGLSDPAAVAEGWVRLDAELDAPRAGLVETALVRLGVAAHTARLLACTPGLRRSWLAGVAFTFTITVGRRAPGAGDDGTDPAARGRPAAPADRGGHLLRPRVDPSYELAVVAPMHTFRLLLLRCAAVLAATTLLTSAASLTLPGYGPVVLGWLAPSLALTLVSLALTPWLGPVRAALLVGLGWAVLLAGTVHAGTGRSALFTTVGQVGLVGAAAVAAIVVWKVRFGFDSVRHLARAVGPASRRTP